jgi:hypothetical protein
VYSNVPHWHLPMAILRLLRCCAPAYPKADDHRQCTGACPSPLPQQGKARHGTGACFGLVADLREKQRSFWAERSAVAESAPARASGTGVRAAVIARVDPAIDPDFGGARPTMFIAANDADAKLTATNLLAEVGWDTADMGTAVAARAIEPLAMLWCIPGFRENSWMHAFKLLH